MAVGKILIFSGIILAFLGVILYFAPQLVGWFGNLPGDIKIQDEKKFIFIPITSMIIVSLILTLLVNLIFRK